MWQGKTITSAQYRVYEDALARSEPQWEQSTQDFMERRRELPVTLTINGRLIDTNKFK